MYVYQINDPTSSIRNMEDVASNLESLVRKLITCTTHFEINLVCVVSGVIGNSSIQYVINVHMFVGSVFFSWKERIRRNIVHYVFVLLLLI
jgi:hypothetical protein